MATFPERIEVSNTGSNPTNAVARIGFGRMYDWLSELVGMWLTAAGTDTITITYAPAITSLVDGQVCRFRSAGANTTTTPTFSPNGLTARTIVKHGGAALVAGNIAGAGHEVVLKYNLANTRWELMNPVITLTTLAALGTAGGNMTGGVNTGVTIVASAATPDIFAATVRNVIDYTGTVTCTGFAAAPQAGVTRRLICAGAAVFTAGANLIIDGTPTGNLTVTAGDILEVTAITTTQFRITQANFAKKNVAQTFTATQTPLRLAATAGAGTTYAWNLANAQVLELTFGAGNITTLSVTGGVIGTFYTLYLKQDGSGNRTIGAYTGFKFSGGNLPTLSAGAAAVDIFTFYYDGTSMNCVGSAIGMA